MEEGHPAGQKRPQTSWTLCLGLVPDRDRQSTAAVTAVCPSALLAPGCPLAGAAPRASHSTSDPMASLLHPLWALDWDSALQPLSVAGALSLAVVGRTQTPSSQLSPLSPGPLEVGRES